MFSKIVSIRRRILQHLIYFDLQHRQALIDIVVQFSPNTLALLLLRLNQPLDYSAKSFFSELSFRDVHDHPNDTLQLTMLIEVRPAIPLQPTDHAIRANDSI